MLTFHNSKRSESKARIVHSYVYNLVQVIALNTALI